MNMEMKMDGQILRINTAEIHGTVYKHVPDKGWWWVKIHMPDLKLYVNSIRVSPSVKHADRQELWVQPPKMPVYTRWITIMEFENGAPLWDLMRDEALRAVDRYEHERLTAEGLDINLDDIQPP